MNCDVNKLKLSLWHFVVVACLCSLWPFISHAASRAERHVGADLETMKGLFRTLLPGEVIEVNRVNKTIALSGTISGAEIAEKAEQIARQYVGPDVQLLNFLKVKNSQQVMLRVRVGEIQRSALRQVGLNLQGARRLGEVTVPFGTGGGLANGLSSTAGIIQPLASDFGAAGVLFRSANGKLDLSATLDMLEQQGLIRMLAEPNLVAISGESARFLAGGEFPVPIAQQFNTMSVEYKPVGVKIDFSPVVLSANRIRLKVEPEVSEITTDIEKGAVRLNNITIPAVTTRRARTTVELAPGESFMIAGLIKDDMRNAVDQLPGLGSIPILSSLFRSTAFQRQETELVIAVTPYLVDPTAHKDIKLPTDQFRAPTGLDMVFFGALGAKGASNIDATVSPAGFVAE
jgi:pilus assembly protein CpaC